MAKSKVVTKGEPMAIYDGRDFLGSIVKVGAYFELYDYAGLYVDKFKTLREAQRRVMPLPDENDYYGD